MATETASSSDFIKNLGKMYGTYTGGFLAFIILLAILEMVGVPNRILGYLFVGFTIAVYAVIGIMTRTAQVSEYYVAGRRVPAFYNGMATGADWMSAASFVGSGGKRVHSIASTMRLTSMYGDFSSRSRAKIFDRSTW